MYARFVYCLYDPRLYRLFQKFNNTGPLSGPTSSSLAIANYHMAHKNVDAGASSSSSRGMYHERIGEDIETGMFSEKKFESQDESANLSDPLMSHSCPMNNKSGLHIFHSSCESSIKPKKAKTEIGVPINYTPNSIYATLMQDATSVAEAKLEIMKHTFQQQGIHTTLNGEVVDHSNQQALLIWAGLLIDAIPESFVIGFMVAKNDTSPLTFIVGVFLSNFPEAMSSSGGISSHANFDTLFSLP
jgi:hypothetical protein